MIKWILSGALVVIVGCQHHVRAPVNLVNIGRDAQLTLPEPREILPEIQLNQMITFKHQGKQNSTQAVLTSGKNKLTLLAFLPFGGEGFRVEYSDHEVRHRSLPGVPAGFDPKFALADIVLIYAELPALQTWVSDGVQVVDEDQMRTISYRQKPLIQIRYSSRDKLHSTIHFEHFERDYSMSIQSIPEEKE